LRFWQNHNELNPGIEKEEIDIRIICKNGEIKWINHVCYTLYDDRGEYLGRRASNRDITERKKIENAIILQRDVNVELIAAENFDEALKIIFKYAVKIDGIDCGGVYLLNEDGNLELSGSFGLTKGFESLVSIYSKNERQYKLVMCGNPIYVRLKDIIGKNVKGKNKKYIKIVASIPFKEKNSVIGTLNLASTIVDEFSERQKQVIETFAFQVGSYLGRHIAEKELRASEEKYRTFFENDLTADFKTTVNGKIIDCNPAFVKMFEFNSKEEALRTPIVKLYKNKNAREKIISKLKTQEKLELIENKLITTKGNEIIVLENIFGEFDHKNKLTGTVGYLLDITQIRMAEDALRESEKKFRDLFESMQDGFALHEIILNRRKRPVNYRFLALNPAFEKMTGLKEAKILGKTVLDFMPNLDKHLIETYGKVALTRRPIRLSFFSGELGKYFKVLAYSPQKMKFATVIEDITESKIAEIKINQLSTAIEQSPVSVIITDLNGDIEYVNNKFIEATGYGKEEAIGKNPRILKSGNTPSTEYRKMWRTIKSGKEWNGIFYNKKKNGELFWESANISPIRNSDGKITHFVAIKEDITEKVKVRNELEMHRNRLEELVRLRTKELDETNRKLKKEIQKEKEFEMMLRQSLEKEKELSELKSRFISTTSHEFRTPLTSVLSSAELIQRYSKKWSEEKLDYHTAKIKNSIEYLTKLLDDVLTISRSESGKIIYDPVKTDVKLLCEEIVEESKTVSNNKHDFNFVFEAKVKEYIVDPKLIRFIVTNLLSNAFKYSPNGGKVELQVHSSNGNILFNVSDEGMGIPADEIPYLFEPFHRAENTIEIPGTGLGLSIVKRAVELHGGEIKIKSKLGKGTIFTVKLPIKIFESCK
jgi:PAS domain S-box-containing protein